MLTDLKTLYRDAWGFARACPLLFLLPAAAELAQHVAEVHIGLFASRAAARAVADHPLRMGLGTVKELALLLVGYGVVRWMAWHDPRRTRTVDAASLRTVLPLLGYSLAALLALLWGLPLLGRMGLAVPRPVSGGITLLLFVAGLLFADWSAHAPLGDAEAGPLRSARLVAPTLPWAFAFQMVATLPPMAVHYGLNYLAFGRPEAVVWALTIVDALWVGYLGVVVSGVVVPISRHARARAERRGGVVPGVPAAA